LVVEKVQPAMVNVSVSRTMCDAAADVREFEVAILTVPPCGHISRLSVFSNPLI
jgi:hypothetical protein